MDGVIVDSEPLHKQSFLEVWNDMGYQENHGIHFPDYYGRSDRVLWKAFIEKHRPEQTIEELIGLREERLIRMLHDLKPIFDGVLPLIKRLAKQYPLGLASGSIHRVIDVVLAIENLRSYFKEITSSEDVLEPKPSPQTFLLSAKRMGITPHKCCVIEDSINGVKAGNAAGMTVLAITNTFEKKELLQSGATLTFENYYEIDNYFFS